MQLRQGIPTARWQMAVVGVAGAALLGAATALLNHRIFRPVALLCAATGLVETMALEELRVRLAAIPESIITEAPAAAVDSPHAPLFSCCPASGERPPPGVMAASVVAEAPAADVALCRSRTEPASDAAESVVERRWMSWAVAAIR